MKKSGFLMVLIALLLFPAVVPAAHAQTLTFSTIDKAKFKTSIISIMTQAYARLGVDINIVALPVQRAIISADQGEYDGELFRIKDMERHFPNMVMVDIPCYWVDVFAYVRTEDQFKVNGWKSIPRNYTLAAQFGLKYMERIIQSHSLKAVFVKDTVQAFKLLISGNANLAVAANSFGEQIVGEQRMTNLVRLSPAIDRVEFCHYLHKKNARLVPKIKAVLQAMHIDGSMDAYLPSLN